MKLKNGSWTVTQQPEIQGALVSIDAQTGAVQALVGGYDFHSKTFNRATQSMRQPGSAFKPFVYSAALSKGFTASTLVNDAPITIRGWSPQNSDGTYSGMITLRQALTWSKNTVSVRIAQAMGVSYLRAYVQRFGFTADQIPPALSIALGTASVTPMQMAEGYAVFANGGYKVAHYVIDKIYDSKDNLRAEMQPLVAGKTAPQVIDPRNAYVMTSLLHDVATKGTGAATNALGRSDIAGKTGTTNDFKDAWFVGYTPKIVTAVYIGYDKPRTIGKGAFGGKIALPMWINYMRFALKGKPVSKFVEPKGVVKRDGEVYLKERQTTDEHLPLDNTTDQPEVVRPLNPPKAQEQDLSPVDNDSGAGERELRPVPSNAPSRSRGNSDDAANAFFED